MARMIIFVDDECQPCEVIKKAYEPYIQKGEVEVMDIHEAAKKWPEEFEKVETVPSMGVESEEGILIYRSDFAGSNIGKLKEVKLE